MSHPRVLLSAFLIAWIGFVGAGASLVLDYQSTPGVEAAAPGDWPAASSLSRSPEGFTLLLFVHPHCPCSRASLDELSWLMSRASDRVTAQIVFVVPPGANDEWGYTALWQQAASCPGSQRRLDHGGKEAGFFGAVTSGQVFLYDEEGHLVFRGGITAGRGHLGENAGRAAVSSHLRGDRHVLAITPVFGCPLLGEIPTDENE